MNATTTTASQTAQTMGDAARLQARIAELEAQVAALRTANRDLQRSEARLGQIVDALPALVGYVDLDQRVVFSNRVIERWYQRPLSTILGKQLRSLFSEVHYRTVEALLERVLSGEEIDEEREITYPDGVTRFVHLNYIPHFDDGEVQGYFFLVNDVTERRRAQEALRRSNEILDQRVRDATARLEKRNRLLRSEIKARRASEERYRVVGEMMSDLVYSYRIYPDGTMTADWFAGKMSKEFAPRLCDDGHHMLWRSIIHADDRKLLEARIKRLLDNESSVDEFRVSDAQGRTRWLRVYGKPQWDEKQARVVRVTVAAQDLTLQRKAEQNFETTKEYLAEALDSMSDGFLLFDAQRRLVAFNTKILEMFPLAAASVRPGATFEQILRASAESGEVKAAQGRAEQWVAERLANYPSLSGASEVELSNGRWIVATDRPTRAGGVVGLRSDITDRKRAEEARRRQDAELAHVLRRASMDEMASALAHELSQPLAVIVNYGRGCMRRMHNESPDLEVIARALGKICDAAERAKDIVKHVGHFVRRSKPELHEEDLTEVVRSVCALSESSLQRNGVQLHIELPPGPLRVLLNRVEIEQVLFNLIRNGIDAMQDKAPGQRSLRLQCTSEGARGYRVTVRDSGMGVVEAVAGSIFEPYITSKDTGLGMGLSISRTIVEAHGGRLWYANNNGGGASFHFTVSTP